MSAAVTALLSVMCVDVWMREVDRAVLSPYGWRRMPVPAGVQPSKAVSGAVYQGRRLVDESQRVGGLLGDHAASLNRARYDHPGDVHLEGTWLYGGTWFNHFGHFLTETITTLWPSGQFSGLLFHSFWFGSDVLPWQQAMLDLAGFDGLPVHVVDSTPTAVERLLVPVRPYIANAYAAPQAVEMWQRITQAVSSTDSPDRVFLSRSAINAAERATSDRRKQRISDNELALDDLMRRHGFTVVFSEQLTVYDQIRMVKGADVVAGVSGSALHLSVFANPTSRVLELGDARNRDEAVITQQILCRAMGHRLGYVRHGPGDGFDLDAVEAAVVALR